MPDQTNRLTYVNAKGGFARFLWRPVLTSQQWNLVALPNSIVNVERDPNLQDMTESDSIGMYEAPTLERNMISVDLRRRQDPVSLDALGIRALSFVDFVVVDIGLTGYCDIWAHMGVGPYRRGQDQRVHISEGFSLTGGGLIYRNIALPTWAQATASALPGIAGYVKTGVTIPTGITGV